MRQNPFQAPATCLTRFVKLDRQSWPGKSWSPALSLYGNKPLSQVISLFEFLIGYRLPVAPSISGLTHKQVQCAVFLERDTRSRCPRNSDIRVLSRAIPAGLNQGPVGKTLLNIVLPFVSSLSVSAPKGATQTTVLLAHTTRSAPAWDEIFESIAKLLNF
jgi:hypothetical protein